jgi:DNA-binding transcriptional LysR family regulator
MLRFSLRELEVFCAVARDGSVHRAAAAVALTQSAASQALARLESGLGVRLFDRRGRRLVLNESGRGLLPQARSLLDAAQALQRVASGGPPALHLAASSTIARYVLPALLRSYRAAHPGAEVRIETGNTADVAGAVASMAVDFGLIEGPCHHAALVVTPWREDALVLIAPPDTDWGRGRATRAQLRAARWLLREAGSGTREEVDHWLHRHVGPVQPDMELGDSEAIWRAVAAGLGISCLPCVMVAEALRRGALIEIQSTIEAPRRMFSVVRHRDRMPTEGLQAFLSIAGAAQG